MITHNLFNDVFVIPILNVLVAFYKLFLLIGLPGAFGFAIVALTGFVRVVLHPLNKKQLEAAKKMQDLKPHLDHLSKKHKEDKARLQREQLKLYKESGVNPASGCLLLLVQIPVFIALFNTLNLFLSNGNGAKAIIGINKVLYFALLKIQSVDPWFFGFNLALSPQKAGAPHYFIIPVITAILQYWQTQVMTPTAQAAPAATVKKDEKTQGAGDDFQKAMNTQMKYIFPIMIGYFSFTLPAGLAIYWNVFSLFSIIQYKRINK